MKFLIAVGLVSLCFCRFVHADPCSALRDIGKNKSRILVLGMGGVAEATVPLLAEKVPNGGITVLDFQDRKEKLAHLKNKGVTFSQIQITPGNMDEVLSQHLNPGDTLADLAWNIGIEDLLTWTRNHGVTYTNTSVEEWDPYSGHRTAAEKTLYHRHQQIEKFTRGWRSDTPTAILENGANPGWISQAAKQGILDIADEYLRRGFAESKTEEFQEARLNQKFNELARLLNIRVMHIAEEDTQDTAGRRTPGQFWNTWSIPGLHEEGTVGAELGRGTHERRLPKGAHTHRSGPQNQIYLDSKGLDTFVRTSVPGGVIEGRVIRHGEADTLSRFLTVMRDGRVIFRPTTHYAYKLAPKARESIDELREKGYPEPEHLHYMNEDIMSGGEDKLGVLFMGSKVGPWWTGSRLTIDRARELVPGTNATTVQVAASVVAGVLYQRTYPNLGVLYPEQLSHTNILRFAMPYLEPWYSGPVRSPVKLHPQKDGSIPDGDLQFSKFLIKKRAN